MFRGALSRPTTPLGYLGVSIAVGLVYWAAANTGLWLGTVKGGTVTAIWPPSGVALAAVLIFGYRVLPALLVADAAGSIGIGIPLVAAVPLAAVTLIEPAVGAALLRAGRGFHVGLDRIRDVVKLALVAPVAPLLSASLGILILVQANRLAPEAAASAWAVWWIADALAILVVAPVLLTWAHPSRLRADRLPEVAALAALTALTAAVTFGWIPLASPAPMPSQLYLVFPVLIWTALRFGPRATATLVFVISAIAAWEAGTRSDLLMDVPLRARLLILQAFMGVQAITGLVLAATMVERKRATAALEAHQEQMAALVEERTRTLAKRESQLSEAQEVGKMGSWEWDLGTNRAFWSDELYRIFGYRPRERQVTYETFLDHVHPGDVARIKADIETSIRTGAPFDTTFRILRRDGTERWLHSRGRFIPGSDGEGRMVGTAQDITTEKHAESEIHRLNRRLEARVAELARANEELEAFSYSTSHDLRAPLRGIHLLSEALLEDERDRLSDEGVDLVRRIERETGRMSNLVADLLTLARVSRSEIRTRDVDLSAMAREVAESLRSTPREHPAEFEIEDDVVAFGDPTLLRIVLENLLGNAWKFTAKVPDGRISFGSEVDENGRTVYYVRDNGAGFNPAEASRLFRPFQRLHGPSEYPGTGIGLATVKRAVERHGGRVWAEGAPGEGATFRFTLAG